MRAAVVDHLIPLVELTRRSCELEKDENTSADSCNRALGMQLAQRSLPPRPMALGPAAAMLTVTACDPVTDPWQHEPRTW
jgi:hypothetical protein